METSSPVYIENKTSEDSNVSPYVPSPVPREGLTSQIRKVKKLWGLLYELCTMRWSLDSTLQQNKAFNMLREARVLSLCRIG